MWRSNTNKLYLYFLFHAITEGILSMWGSCFRCANFPVLYIIHFSGLILIVGLHPKTKRIEKTLISLFNFVLNRLLKLVHLCHNISSLHDKVAGFFYDIPRLYKFHLLLHTLQKMVSFYLANCLCCSNNYSSITLQKPVMLFSSVWPPF